VHSSGRGALIKTHCLYSLQEAPPHHPLLRRPRKLPFPAQAPFSFPSHLAVSLPQPLPLALARALPGVLLRKLSGNSLKITREGSLLRRLPDLLSRSGRVNNRSFCLYPRGSAAHPIPFSLPLEIPLHRRGEVGVIRCSIDERC